MDHSTKENLLFSKIYISNLMPYPSDKIIKMDAVDIEQFNKIFLAKFNFEKLKSK